MMCVSRRPLGSGEKEGFLSGRQRACCLPNLPSLPKNSTLSHTDQVSVVCGLSMSLRSTASV